MAIILPFYQKERDEDSKPKTDRKSELCKPESLPVRVFGTVLLCLVVPYYVLKICFAPNA